MTQDTTARAVAAGLIVAAAYVLAAKVGFLFAFTAEQVTTVWAPSGLSIAALLLFGQRLAPAIWLGAFVANAGSDAPLWTAAAIATGNMLEAVIATAALRRWAHFDPDFCRIRDVLAFLIIAVLLSTAVSATIGVITLCMAGAQPWTRFGELWAAWWLGDALGALVIAPAILSVAGRGLEWLRRHWRESALLVGGVIIVTEIVFGQVFGPASAYHPLEYVIFPFVIAAAVRGGPPATALVVCAASAVSIWNTSLGVGPFAEPELHQSLVLLQVFLGVLAGTGLLLGAAIAERTTGERRRAAAAAVGQVLVGAPALAPVAPAVLRAICENLNWQVGGLWMVASHEQRLRCAAVWSDKSTSAAAFERTSSEASFSPGTGLPGRVWETGEPAWIEDVAEDDSFSRAELARQSDLHGAFAFPIKLDDDVVGVVECFNRAIMRPDPDLLRSMATVGTQIGLFLGRKREEVAAALGQRRTSAILETALDAVIGMDHLGLITDFNPAAVKVFGYSTEDALRRELADLLIPPALRQQHRDGLQRFLATGEGPLIGRRVETVGYHADGHEFPVEVSITRVAGADPPTFTGFVRDLTTRVAAEREREELLRREATARSEAEAANRAKDDFLATLSHELRTPLNAIVGWTHMLLDGNMDAARAKRALEVIARNASLQGQLIADLLDISRIITGGVQLDVRPMNLATVISAALDAVRPSADAKSVRLVSRLATSARLMEGDPQRLQQVAWNLLSNAVKFTPAGGTVTVEVIEGDRDVQLKVHDTGSGIDGDFLPHVFERFRQADGSATRQHGGLGLGLSIVNHLVQLHGGSVRVESPGRDQGATFTVTLPVVPPVSAPPRDAGGEHISA